MRKVLTSLIIVAIATSLSVFSGCSRNQKKQRPAPVVTAKAEVGDAPYVLSTVGTIKASVSVNIKSKYAAHIKKVHFTEGSLVKAGDVLYTIDPQVNALTEQQAGATYQRDRADYEQLERDLKRYKTLADQGVISREQFEEKQTATVRARNAMRASGAGASIARQNLTYNTITSPIDGRIGASLFDEGSFVKDKDDILAVVNTSSPLDVTFALPERYLSDIRKEMQKGPLSVQAAAPGMEDHPEAGVLTFLDNQVETGTGTVRLKARFENPEGRLWPGQFVNVGLVLKTVPNCVLAPARAVQTGPDGRFVFVIKEGKAEMRPVTTGFRVRDMLVIEKGLEKGEEVVTEGQLRLFPGAAVIPQEKAPQEKKGEAKPGQPDAAGAAGTTGSASGASRKD